MCPLDTAWFDYSVNVKSGWIYIFFGGGHLEK